MATIDRAQLSIGGNVVELVSSKLFFCTKKVDTDLDATKLIKATQNEHHSCVEKSNEALDECFRQLNC